MSDYLKIISKKAIQEYEKTDEVIMSESLHPYGIEAELGSKETTTHVLLDKNGRTINSIAEDYFEPKYNVPVKDIRKIDALSYINGNIVSPTDHPEMFKSTVDGRVNDHDNSNRRLLF